MATRRNQDGSVSFVTESPGVNGFECLVGDTDANRSLTMRDAQHVYTFQETTTSATSVKADMPFS